MIKRLNDEKIVSNTFPTLGIYGFVFGRTSSNPVYEIER